MNKPAATDAEAAPMLVVRAVVKTYWMGAKPVPVLRGVDLVLRRGEFLAVRGASGAGKSTLLHLIGGLDEPTSGEVRFEDVPLSQKGNVALARFRNRKIGFVFQAFHLLPELDALENVCLPARLARIPSSTAESRARELLAQVGLGERLHHRPRQLSGGEQQRVAIARALVNDPALLLADEPTGNLDSRTGGEIIDLLCRLRAERQTSLIIATHDRAISERAPRQMDLVDGVVQNPTGS